MFNVSTNNVETYVNFAAFPVTGQSNVFYIDLSTSIVYYFDVTYKTTSSPSGNLSGVVQLDSSAQILISSGSNINDLSHANLSTGNYLLLNPTNDIDITGITAPLEAIYQVLFISNISNSKKVKLKNNNSSSSSDNRFLFKGDITIEKNMGQIIIYDQVMSKWRSLTKNN